MSITLTVHTNQEAFDTAYRAIISQGQRSMTLDPTQPDRDLLSCAYINEKGHSCGIGHLIPLEERAKLENTSISALCESGIIEAGDLDVDLLQDIQRAHDRAGSQQHSDDFSHALEMYEFHRTMVDVAERWKLNTKAILDVRGPA